MTNPPSAFECVYISDRRKHRHRCVCCNRVVAAGETVVMANIHKGSKVAHLECADREITGGWTWRDSLASWGTKHLKSLGYRMPDHPMMRVG